VRGVRTLLPAVAALAPLLTAACTSGAGASGAGGSSSTVIDPNDPVVQISAHQFTYSPDTVSLELGVAVTLELTSEDVWHGFNLPDFNLRADILPGEPTRVRLVPDKAGTFTFLCDHYCGWNHENMNGTIVVQ
jgi:cytochrome c oxidase subunit 2